MAAEPAMMHCFYDYHSKQRHLCVWEHCVLEEEVVPARKQHCSIFFFLLLDNLSNIYMGQVGINPA